MSPVKRSILLLAVARAVVIGQVHTPESRVQKSPEAIYVELDGLVVQRQYSRADKIEHQLLVSSDDPAATCFQIGQIYFDHEDWQRSAAFLEQSLRLKGTNDKAHQLLGLDWRELHRPDNAETELLEAAKENPSNRVNAYLAGHQLLLNGKFDVALQYLYSALDWKPLQSQVLQALALAQARLGNYGLAESYYRKAVDSAQASEDDHYSALINLSTLLLLGHDSPSLEEGLSCARQAERLRPDSPEARFLAGKALFKLGRLGEASPELARSVKLNPKDSKTHFLLAKIYDKLGQPDWARKERKAVARIKGHPGQAGMAALEPAPVTPEDFSESLHR